jgi:hypothetical protein
MSSNSITVGCRRAIASVVSASAHKVSSLNFCGVIASAPSRSS